MIVDPATIERFWDKVEKTDSCWLWRAACRKGYGAFKFSGRVYDAHRFSYILAHGDIPEGMAVCHHCDQPLCVRPDHFFLGTIRDNNLDMHQKGRHKGGVNWDPDREVREHSTEGTTAKLDHKTADVIRLMHGMGYSVKDLAAQFKVARRTVQDVVAGKTW